MQTPLITVTITIAIAITITIIVKITTTIRITTIIIIIITAPLASGAFKGRLQAPLIERCLQAALSRGTCKRF